MSFGTQQSHLVMFFGSEEPQGLIQSESDISFSVSLDPNIMHNVTMVSSAEAS